ncbi:MAG TPA: hypothetical protein VHY37_05285, partial [Tepidisphaeraceae bacterium]|nr:hypothetical protein [Tepidisphaeraceae bacterium]
MASLSPSSLHLPPLMKRRMAELVAKANRLGMPPEDYAKHIVEDGLALEREAEKTSFAEIMGPVRRAAGVVGEAEIVRLVGGARRG